MVASVEESLDSLLRENRKIQANIISRIRLINFHILICDTFLGLRAKHEKASKTKINEVSTANQDVWFRVWCGSRAYVPPLLPQFTPHCLTMYPKFRWNQRATRSLKRQVERIGLHDSGSEDPEMWQAVADAVNYDSKASIYVDSFQCYLHYQHVLTPLSDSFLPEEDKLIIKRAPARGWLHQLVEDILQVFGRRRTKFQVAERYRRLNRLSYEQLCVPVGEISSVMEAEWLITPVTCATECLVGYTLRLNAGRALPWLTEESVRLALASGKMAQKDNEKNLFREKIFAVLLNGEDYTSSTHARKIVLRLLKSHPLRISDECRRVKFRYTQISVDTAAKRLGSSVPELKGRVLAKVLRRHGTVYASDFFRLSVELFGQRDSAMACFLIAREYERERRKKSLPYGRLKLF